MCCILERGEVQILGISRGMHGAWSAMGTTPTLLRAVLSPLQGEKSAAVQHVLGVETRL